MSVTEYVYHISHLSPCATIRPQRVWPDCFQLHYNPTTEVTHLVGNQQVLFVWFDGACRNNGTPSAHGAWGVYVGHGSQYNKCGPLPPSYRQTNSRAEIEGLIQAIGVIRRLSERMTIQKVYICSDSKYLVKSMTLWVENWILHNGRKYRGGHVANFGALVDARNGLLDLVSSRSMNDIVFWHIPREHNAAADALANQGFQTQTESWGGYSNQQQVPEPTQPTESATPNPTQDQPLVLNHGHLRLYQPNEAGELEPLLRYGDEQPLPKPDNAEGSSATAVDSHPTQEEPRVVHHGYQRLYRLNEAGELVPLVTYGDEKPMPEPDTAEDRSTTAVGSSVDEEPQTPPAAHSSTKKESRRPRPTNKRDGSTKADSSPSQDSPQTGKLPNTVEYSTSHFINKLLDQALHADIELENDEAEKLASPADLMAYVLNRKIQVTVSLAEILFFLCKGGHRAEVHKYFEDRYP